MVGAGSIRQIDDAAASLDLDLTDDEVRTFEAPYTPRYDWQGVSDDAELEVIRKRVPGCRSEGHRPVGPGRTDRRKERSRP